MQPIEIIVIGFVSLLFILASIFFFVTDNRLNTDSNLLYTPAGNILSSDLKTPSNLSLQTQDNGVVLTWSKVHEADSYVVYQSIFPDFNYQVLILYIIFTTQKADFLHAVCLKDLKN